MATSLTLASLDELTLRDACVMRFIVFRLLLLLLLHRLLLVAAGGDMVARVVLVTLLGRLLRGDCRRHCTCGLLEVRLSKLVIIIVHFWIRRDVHRHDYDLRGLWLNIDFIGRATESITAF